MRNIHLMPLLNKMEPLNGVLLQGALHFKPIMLMTTNALSVKNITVSNAGTFITREWHATNTKSTILLTKMTRNLLILLRMQTIGNAQGVIFTWRKIMDVVQWVADAARSFAIIVGGQLVLMVIVETRNESWSLLFKLTFLMKFNT